MAPVQMTRAQYEAKYGQPVPSSITPTQMTRAQYEAKYGTQEKKSFADMVPHSTYDPNKVGLVNIPKAIGNIPHEVATAVSNIAKVPGAIYDTVTDPNVKARGFLGGAKDFATSLYDVAGKPLVQGLSTLGNTMLGGLQAGVEVTTGMNLGDKNAEQAWNSKAENAYNLAQGIQRSLVEAPLATASIARKPITKVTEPITKVTEPITNAVKPIVNRAMPDLLTKDVSTLRAEKVRSGFMEQNTRLKTAEKAFNDNTRTYTQPDGVKVKVTPVDTLGKYDIVPEVDKGTLQMGDYTNGTGALGKIHEHVSAIDDSVTSFLKENASDVGVPIDTFKSKVISAIEKDDNLKRAGKVESTKSKLDTVFEDYKKSYGDNLSEFEINEIRKVMNRDWHPDTVDASKVIGNAARDVVYTITPDLRVKQMLQEQANLMRAKNYAEKINNTKVVGGRLGNMALRTTGAIIGSGVGGVPILGPLFGALGGEYAARLLQQSQFKSLGVETKALLQRSNNIRQTMSANMMPNTEIIPKTIPQTAQKGTPLSTATPAPVQKTSLPTSIADDPAMIKRLTRERGAVGKPSDEFLLASAKRELKKTPNDPKLKAFVAEKELMVEARKYKTAEEFANTVPNSTLDKLREQGVRGGEQRMAFWEKATGKKASESYTMSHRPNEEGVSAFNLTEKVDGEQRIPKDMYEEWYGSRGTLADIESINVLKKIKGKPDVDVTIYRASPKESFNEGDWVTFSKKYAEEHASANNTKVFSKVVKAKDVRWAMDDINEFGYYPKKSDAMKIIDDRYAKGDISKSTYNKAMKGEGAKRPYTWDNRAHATAPQKSTTQKVKDFMFPAGLDTERGMVKLPYSGGKVKAIDVATKEDLRAVQKYLQWSLKTGKTNKKYEDMFASLAKKYDINVNASAQDQIKRIDKLLEKTDTMETVPGGK